MTKSPISPATACTDRNSRYAQKPAWRTPVLRQVQLPQATLGGTGANDDGFLFQS